MTKDQAVELAKWNDTYRAKKCRDGSWGVWCDTSDHWVEFDIINSRDVNYGPNG